MSLFRKILGSGLWGYALFWSWNAVFGVFMLLGFSTQVLPDLVSAVLNSVVPAYFLVVGILLALIPLVAMVLAATTLRRAPGRLFALAYGVEWPLMFILALRFFVLRDATPGVTLIFSLAVLGMATLLWQILDAQIDTRSTPLTAVRAAGLTLLLLVYGYSSVGIAFYALPLAAGIVRLIGDALSALVRYGITFDWLSLLRGGLLAATFSLTGGVLALLSATLFVLTPVAVPILAWRAWRRALTALAGRIGSHATIRTTVAVAAVCVVSVIWTNQQSQGAAFALLKSPPTTPADAQALVRQESTLRSGLLNSYLATYRYISAVGEVRHIAEIYEAALGLSSQQAAGVESLYEVVVRPLLYEPASEPAPATMAATGTTRRVDGRALSQEPAQAAKLYQAYFDERIVDGEHATVANAVRSTWLGTQAEAALQDVEDRKVHLTRQEITTTEHGDWAEVEIYEVYQNRTVQRQEIVYYFSLPESAVVTGVWLGDSPDRERRYAFRVAPRGAAQAVYRNEVRANLDPALLEQIGPRQYRLRVFPIAAQSWRGSQATGRAPVIQEGAPLYMWFTYGVLAQENTWPLPRLAEKRNVYWDEATTRVVNGAASAATLPDGEWLPHAVPASAPIQRAAHRVEFAGGETVVAQPMAAAELPALPANVKLAVVLDRSRSMRTVAAEVKATLARLATIPLVDVYLTASPYRGEPPRRLALSALDRESIDYAGGQTPGELLAQYDALRAGDTYDAVVVVTDAAGYELGAGSAQFPVPSAPVWMVHLGSRLPLGYDDATLDAIQASGGSVTGSIEEALQRIAFGLTRGARTTVDWVDGYTWEATAQGARGPAAAAGDTAFAPLAARRLVLDAMYRSRTTLHQTATLDQLHAVALEHGIVTPFSSMLVLVTPQQEQLLKQLEDRKDRYDREVEQVGDTVGQSALQAMAVPEPHEWLLIGLAALVLAVYAIRTRRPDWNPLWEPHGKTRLS